MVMHFLTHAITATQHCILPYPSLWVFSIVVVVVVVVRIVVVVDDDVNVVVVVTVLSKSRAHSFDVTLLVLS
jgi:hypothetical protein